MTLPSNVSLAKIMRHIKGGSSYWINKNIPNMEYFAWQEGYSAFSVGYYNVEKIQNYIKNQREHHKRFDFEHEMTRLQERYMKSGAEVAQD